MLHHHSASASAALLYVSQDESLVVDVQRVHRSAECVVVLRLSIRDARSWFTLTLKCEPDR